MPPLFILFDEGAAAVFSTGTVFVVGVIRLTLLGFISTIEPSLCHANPLQNVYYLTMRSGLVH